MATIADWLQRAIKGHKDDKALKTLAAEVKEFSLQFPLPSDKK
jgi:glycine/serine hydroxymethyltransferase